MTKKLSELMEPHRHDNPTDEDVARWIGLAKDLESVVEADIEAIAWAYQKLCNFGIQNSTEDNAMMMDRLNLMLLQAPSMEPEVTEGYEVGVTFMDRNPKPLGNL